MSRDFRGISSPAMPVPVFHESPDNGSAPFLCSRLLHLFNGLLSQEDQQLPFTGHVVSIIDDIIFNQWSEAVVLVRSQEVVVGDPESEIIAGAIVIIETVGGPVGSFISTVKPFDHLLIRPEFF